MGESSQNNKKDSQAQKDLEKWKKLQDGIQMRNLIQSAQVKDLKFGVVTPDR